MRIGEPRKVHFKTRIRVVFALIAVGGVALICAGFNTINNDRIFRHNSEALDAHGVRTVGKVVSVSSTAGDGMYPGSTSLRVRFTDQSGRAVIASAGFLGQPTMRVGNSVGIIYDSKDPELIDLVHDRSYPQSTSEDEATNLGIALVVLGVLVTLTFAVLPFLRLRRAPTPPAWYPDPWRVADWRYWNGHQWTADTSGVSTVP
jgi:hypothetical protein